MIESTSSYLNKNVLYEKKHRYIMILKEINVLYNQADSEVENNKIPPFKAKQIKDMYNQTLIGLIEEGLEYQYIKDNSNSANDIISITIDGINYRCKNTDIKELLNDRYQDVMGIEYRGPNLKKNVPDENDYKIPDIPKNNPNIDIQSFIPPKVYISPDNDFTKEKKTSIFSILKQVITTIILFAIIGGIILFIWGDNGRRTTIKNGWDNLVNQFENTQNSKSIGNNIEESSIENIEDITE